MDDDKGVLDSAMAMALNLAVYAAEKSPCAKSKRGAVIWNKYGDTVASGTNHQPVGIVCDASEKCRLHCNKRCIHAEAEALMRAGGKAKGANMLHIKVVDGDPVASGPPSCWQCSRHILDAGIKTMWLLEDDGWNSYTAEEFHTITMRNCGI